MNDFRYAARMLARNRGLTIVISSLLALGIGMSTVIFSLFDAVLLRPLPVRHPEELVRMVQHQPKTNLTYSEFPYDYYLALRDRSTTLSSVFGQAGGYRRFTMSDPAPAEQIVVNGVTPEFFEGLGTQALRGRVLTVDDAKEDGASPPAVLSYGFWRKRFPDDGNAIGQTIVVQKRKFVVVGVTRPEFNGYNADTSPDVRIPIRAYLTLTDPPATHPGVDMAGRLKPRVSKEQAEAECLALWRPVAEQYYRDWLHWSPPVIAFQLNLGMTLDPLTRGVSILRDRLGDTLKLLMVSVALLVFLICANIGGLLLARAIASKHEISVRLAIGATRFRLFRQSLAEGVLMAALGALGAFGIALLVTPLVSRILPPVRDVATTRLPLSIDVALDFRVFLFFLSCSGLAIVLFSAAPALTAARWNLDTTLRGARASSGSGGWSFLIVLQIALCTLLLAGAGLFVRTFQQLRSLNPGFDESHVATFTADVSNYKPAEQAALLRALTERVREIPGVEAVGLASRGVMRGRGLGTSVVVPGLPAEAAGILNTSTNNVSPEYFASMGMRLLAGREFTPADTPPLKPAGPVKVIVNEAFVKRFFPHEDPLGRRFGTGVPVIQGESEIVGVVSDAKYRSLREPVVPTFFSVSPLYQSFVLSVRTTNPPESMFEPVRKALAAVDGNLAFTEMDTLADEVDSNLAGERITAGLASAFGALAVLLTAVGIYGLIAFTVTRRNREIGIRMALGAGPGDIGRLMGRESVILALLGISLGLAATFLAAHWIRALLYGVGTADPRSLIGAGVFVVLVSAVATAVPAARAMRIDPASALRRDS